MEFMSFEYPQSKRVVAGEGIKTDITIDWDSQASARDRCKSSHNWVCSQKRVCTEDSTASRIPINISHRSTNLRFAVVRWPPP